MLPFIIQIQDGLPVSDQIIQAVRKAMLTQQLAVGDIFPSVRTLSQELRISPTTAHKVVATLKDTGYLASRPGIGIPVTGKDLRTAIDAVLAGKPTTALQVASIGCNIKWKVGNEPDYF